MPTEEARRRAGLLTETRINRISLAGLAVSFVLLLVAFIAAVNGFRTTERSSSLVDHTYEVKDTISDAIADIERTEATRRGYLLQADDHARLRRYREAVADLLPTLDRLDSLTLDNVAQQQRIDQLRPLLQAALGDMEDTVRLMEGGDSDLAIELFDNDSDLQRLREIRSTAAAIEAAEDELLAERLMAERRSLGRVQLLLALIGAGLLVTALGTIWVLWRQLRALFESRSQLAHLNTGLETAVATRTADLKRANEEIQRFAYIVSHDLRSPLVNVMGFTAELEGADKDLAAFLDAVEAERPDLVTKEASYAVREDLPEAVEFIRSSTKKMDRLINAILDLSRQGRRVLDPQQLDMERVLGEVADTFVTLAEERDAAIEIETPLPHIRHDRIAVEQIFSNLIENALKYLRPGVPGQVVVRGWADGDRSVFEVEDNGRGIKESDHQRVFDLFRRSGEQDQRGEGIGLANVRALAYRLGGTVDVRSEFGRGSVFSVILPTEFEEEGTSHG